MERCRVVVRDLGVRVLTVEPKGRRPGLRRRRRRRHRRRRRRDEASEHVDVRGVIPKDALIVRSVHLAVDVADFIDDHVFVRGVKFVPRDDLIVVGMPVKHTPRLRVGVASVPAASVLLDHDTSHRGVPELHLVDQALVVHAVARPETPEVQRRGARAVENLDLVLGLGVLDKLARGRAVHVEPNHRVSNHREPQGILLHGFDQDRHGDVLPGVDDDRDVGGVGVFAVLPVRGGVRPKSNRAVQVVAAAAHARPAHQSDAPSVVPERRDELRLVHARRANPSLEGQGVGRREAAGQVLVAVLRPHRRRRRRQHQLDRLRGRRRRRRRRRERRLRRRRLRGEDVHRTGVSRLTEVVAWRADEHVVAVDGDGSAEHVSGDGTAVLVCLGRDRRHENPLERRRRRNWRRRHRRGRRRRRRVRSRARGVRTGCFRNDGDANVGHGA